jgi:hypothetical protein
VARLSQEVQAAAALVHQLRKRVPAAICTAAAQRLACARPTALLPETADLPSLSGGRC